MSSTDTISQDSKEQTQITSIIASEANMQLLKFFNVNIHEEEFASNNSFSFLVTQKVKEEQEILIDGTCENFLSGDWLAVSLGLDNFPSEETESLVAKTFINFDEVAMKTFRKDGQLVMIPSEGFKLKPFILSDGTTAYTLSKS